MKKEISIEYFKEHVGYEPDQDDLDRCNCDKIGQVGHYQCGWCSQCDLPIFICGHFPPVWKIKEEGEHDICIATAENWGSLSDNDKVRMERLLFHMGECPINYKEMINKVNNQALIRHKLSGEENPPALITCFTYVDIEEIDSNKRDRMSGHITEKLGELLNTFVEEYGLKNLVIIHAHQTMPPNLKIIKE